MIEENNSVINIDKLIQKIREEVANRQGYSELTNTKTNTDAVNVILDIGSNISYIESLLKNAESRAYVRTKWPDKLNHFPFNLTKPFQKIALKLLNFLFKDQREVNFNLILSLKESVTLNRQLIAQIKTLKTQMDERFEGVDRHLQGFDRRLEGVDNHLQGFDEKLEGVDRHLQGFDRRLEGVDRHLQGFDEKLEGVDRHLQGFDRRLEGVDRHLQGFDEKLEGVDRHLQGFDERLEGVDRHLQGFDERYLRNDSYLKNDLMQQKRLISLFLEEARQRLPEPFHQDQLQTFVNENQHFLDAFYVAFEEQFRGSREDVFNRLKIYLPLIEEAQVGTSELPIVDVGCGRGEWLELLRESGYTARGIDINKVMLEYCQSRGLEVIEADVLDYLQGLPDCSLGAVTGFHIIEHLSFETLVKLFDETVRVLKPDGLVIFETPNPRNILVGSGDFYRDPTHKNPIHPDTIRFLAESRGLIKSESYFFEEIEGRSHLVNSSERTFNDLNDYVKVSRDMVLIAYKA